MNANYHEYTAQKALCCVMSTPGVVAICLLLYIHWEAKPAHCSRLSQHAQHAISLLWFSFPRCNGNNRQLYYCIVMHSIAFCSLLLKRNWYLEQLTWRWLSQVNSKNQLHDADISVLITMLTIKLSHHLMNLYCPVGSRRGSAIFPLEAKNILYSDLNTNLKEAGKVCSKVIFKDHFKIAIRCHNN